MITLHKTSEATEIAKLYESERDRKGQPVYWHPRKEEKYRMGIDDVSKYVGSEKFRDYYRLSVLDAQKIAKALKRGKDVPEDANKGLQNKFFRVKKDMEKKLYTEMDLAGGNQFIKVGFPESRKEWSGLHITIGSSGSGKTFHTLSMIEENLHGKRSERRQIVYASTELNKDKTLKKLMADRYRPYVTGVDLSDDAFEESESDTVEQWFQQDILPAFKNLRAGAHVVLDDPRDSLASKYLLAWQNTAYRTLRHQDVGMTSIQHSMRGGRWSSQAYSSVKYVHTFPRGSGKGKLTDYLSKEIGVPLRKAREYVQRYADNGRVMSIRMHSPTCLIGPKGIVLL